MTVVFGVLNVTPDSFSDGGRYLDPEAAVRHGLALVADGADVIDVGGESTRPGAEPVDPAEEAARVLPVVSRLADAGVRVSIDTRSARVAAAALDAGAEIVNDVSGGTADAAMAALVAERAADLVVMHSRGPAGTAVPYGDVVAEVRDELAQRVAAAVAAGVDPARIVVDPGIGFSKGAADNWTLLGRLPEVAGGRRLLLGASRKRFLADVATGPDPTDRDVPTAVLSALARLDGVWGVRVHDVAGTRAALAVAERWAAALEGRP